MSVQLDIESQCLESKEFPEGSSSSSSNSPRTCRWRLISLTVRAGLAFASKTATKPDDELPFLRGPRPRRWRLICMAVRAALAFASKTATKPDDEPPFLPGPRTRRWRLIWLTVRAGRAFASKTPTQPDDELPFLGGQGSRNGDVELASISASIQVSSHYESNQASYNCNIDKQQQYARLAMIVKKKNLNSLNQSGGVKGFAAAVGIDLEKGLPSNADNGLPCRSVILSPHSETGPLHNEFISLLKNTCNNYLLFLILLCAILLLILGIKEEGWETGWYQGILIFLSILVCITASLTLEYWFLWRGSKMKSISNNREVYLDVLRGGQQCKISISKVVLGDIVCLNVGSKVPADGLFVSGESLRLDEESQSTINDQNPFLFSGANVIHGKGNMIVTSISEEMSEVTSPPTKKTSLQLQVDRLNTWTQIVALLITNFLVLVTLLRFTFDKENDHPGSPDVKKKPAAMMEFMNGVKKIITTSSRLRIFTSSLTMILLGFAEGMPFIVTLAIGYWNKKAITDKAITQDFMACLTAGSVTAICTDILAGLTISHVELDMYIGQELINDESKIDPHVREALCDGIGTLLLRLQRPVSLMEHALLTWAPVNLGLETKGYSIFYEKELVSHEASRVLTSKDKVNQDNLDSHWNGPVTNILSQCSRYYDSTGTIKAFNGRDKKDLEEVIENAQVKYLKSIAFGYKQANTRTFEGTDLVLIGWLGLKHPFRRPMKALTEAGVAIKMVSKYGVEELKSIALQWGLDIPNSDSDHTVILGDQFRTYTHEQRKEMVDRICIMGHALPSDELLMVECLKEKAHTVVMVGVTSDDMQSNVEADVGITMGECSTEAVSDSSKIVISRGDFSTLLAIVKFGRCARENIQSFIRVELTMTIAWLLINIITTNCFGDSPITGVQFFWICLIESFIGGPGLLTVSPNDVIMKKSPERGSVSLLTRTMWRSIIAEALYQTAILVTFQYKGRVILGISTKVATTMIFNSFVLCQVFNWFNARNMKEKNVILEINRSCWFWVTICVTLVLQETYIEMAHIFTKNARLNIRQWAVCFLIGGASCMIDWFNKCISDLAKHCCITVSTSMSRTAS